MGLKPPSEFSRPISGDMVDIYVGPKQKHWHLPKRLLSRRSTFFEKRFEGAFKEATEKVLYLPEDDPTGFEVFVQWMYQGVVQDHDTFTTHYEYPLSAYIALYHLAGKLCLEGPQNEAIERIVRTFWDVKSGINAFKILEIYQKTGPHSTLRKLSVDLAAHRVMLGAEVEEYQVCIGDADCFPMDKMKALKAAREPNRTNPLGKFWNLLGPLYQYSLDVEKGKK